MTRTVQSVVQAVDGPRQARRRVLWVMKGLGRGGAERLAVDCARSFNRARWDIKVVYVLAHKDALVHDLRDGGVEVRCVNDGGWRGSWAHALIRQVRDGGYDLVHTHSPAPAVVVRALPHGWRPPVVHTEHNVWARYHPVTRWANALTYGRNAGALAVSGGVARSARPPLGAAPPAVLHHGIDLAGARRGAHARRSARVALGVPVDVPVIGSVANFTPKKDHATLLMALAVVLKRHPAVQLVLVGSGPLEDAVRARVRALGLGGAVMFAGSRSDVAEILPAFDLFALSSKYEGLPIALLEAMASGIAPVATCVGGIPEVITDGENGRLLPAGQPDAFGLALADLLDVPDRRARLAARARRRAADFDITRAVRRMERWYEEILS